MPIERLGPPAAFAAGTQAPAVAATTATAVVSTEMSLLMGVLHAGRPHAAVARLGDPAHAQGGVLPGGRAGKEVGGHLRKNFIDL
ncbi:hypothetical protein GCM10009557_33690 [Virgisporangium ochraceum]|uniref:Uncharacterized protein n=1 Tax=Virgisporangium ochraceum TaxID=65505 RepID=A0A8J3ZX02_9ACTN|nr:hypothetical protein Voc01_046000 [Virgisporangium ochraceum]